MKIRGRHYFKKIPVLEVEIYAKYVQFGGHFENQDGGHFHFYKKYKHSVFNIR